VITLLLKQRLLPDIRRLSKDDFLFQQDGAPADRSHYTVAYLSFHVPEFIEPENWAKIVCKLFSAKSVATVGVHPKIADIDWLKCVLINCSTQQSEDTGPSNQSGAKKTGDGYQGKEGGHVELRLDNFGVHMIIAVIFTVCSS